VTDAPQRGSTGIARHGRLRRRHGWGTALAVVASTLAVVLVSGTSVAAIATATLVNAPTTVQLSTDDQNTAKTQDISAIKGGANILLMGSDTRVGQFDEATEATGVEGARNDVTILVHVSEDHTQLTAVSFPRDLMVPIPACANPETGQKFPAESSAQFNTALGNGGVSCVVDTVENLTGLSIPYAGVITFDGVIEMSNAVGGVTVCAANAINDTYTGLHLTAGEHTISGTEALAFLRTRHGVGDGSDLARISSQQVFLSALLRKVTSDGTLSNPVTLYKLAHAALSNLTLSDGLASTRTLVGLASMLRGMNTSNMLFVQYPVADDPSNSARVIVSQDDAHTLNVALQNDTKTSLSDSSTGRASKEDASASAGASSSGSSGTGSSGTGSSSTGSSSTGTATGGATSTPTATSTPLPSSITGQSAAEQTCSVGN
jgi:LCP family protein required for cell wall assembly